MHPASFGVSPRTGRRRRPPSRPGRLTMSGSHYNPQRPAGSQPGNHRRWLPLGLCRILGSTLAQRDALWIRSDAEECERLRSLYKGKDVTLVAQALGSRSEERTLYLTREPACSSLYKPDPVLTKSMPELHCASEIGGTTISLWQTTFLKSTLSSWIRKARNGRPARWRAVARLSVLSK